MDHRALTPAISIAPVMLGGNVFGWTADEPMSRRLLDHFVARGFSAIDTADTYMAGFPGCTGGQSERIIGKWLKERGRRDDVVIATKVGWWAERPGLSAANIEAAIEDSLRRLQTDYVDIYFAHKFDDATRQEESLRAFHRLVTAGKVRAIGASNFNAAQLQAAHAISDAEGLARYEMLQPRYNLYDRAAFEDALAPVASAAQMGVVPYFGLASGFLSGKYRSAADIEGKARSGLVAHYVNDRGLRILNALDEVAAQLGSTPAKVAIAWLVGQPGITAPIVSATSIAQLDDLLDAASLPLSANQTALLDRASTREVAN